MTRRPRSRRFGLPASLGSRVARGSLRPVPHPSSGDPDICPLGRRRSEEIFLVDRVAPQLPGLSSPADRRNCECSVEQGQVGSKDLNTGISRQLPGTSALLRSRGPFGASRNRVFTLATLWVLLSGLRHHPHFSVRSQFFGHDFAPCRRGKARNAGRSQRRRDRPLYRDGPFACLAVPAAPAEGRPLLAVRSDAVAAASV
jgi:hypothetical protein